jgi:hypothetical protein
MTRVVVEPEADAEILEATEWYEKRQEALGLRFLSDLDDALNMLPRRKLKPDRDLGSEGFLTCDVGAPWPYRFIIIESADTRHAIALAHLRREPGYWRERTPR